MNADFLNLQNFFYRIYAFLRNISVESIIEFINKYWPILAKISVFISVLLIAWVVYLMVKLKETEKKDEEKYGKVIESETKESEIKNERWLKVLDHLESLNQAEWKTAIIEADIILSEMMVKMGYHGDTLGEKLNSVEKSDFLTIDKAWEAHKVRNIIAHEGSNYEITKREAKRIVDLYRQVFEEFKFI
jgi:hypothetical protein